jgi:23S rRNA pseudouridine1911/1915/1917 synthase
MTGPVWSVSSEEAGLRLDKFLAAATRLGTRGRAVAALERGKVFVNDEEATTAHAGRRLAPGDRIQVWMDRPGSRRRRSGHSAAGGALPIMYEDDRMIVVNKPPGLLTVPLVRRDEAPSVEELLVEHLRARGRGRPFVVHRIDRDTSGLVVFALRSDAQERLKEQFRRREPERVYLAIVYGHPSPPSGSWSDHLVWDRHALVQKETHPRDPLGKAALSEYRTVETFRDTSLIEVRLITGKRNQIRLQARLRGHTLVGEQRYIYGPQSLRPLAFPRQALHAWRLAFAHPADGRRLRFEAPLPSDMMELLARLRRGIRQS